MELRSFQIDVPGKGTVDVDFTLHFNSSAISISDIKVHADFDTTLPHRPQLKLHDNSWQLYAQQPIMKNNEVIVVDEYLNDNISKEIVKRLLQYRDEARVR